MRIHSSFAIPLMLLLALGTAVSAVSLGAVHLLLFKPLPYAEADALDHERQFQLRDQQQHRHGGLDFFQHVDEHEAGGAGKFVVDRGEIVPFGARVVRGGLRGGKGTDVETGVGEEQHETATHLGVTVHDENFFHEIHG